jgi:nucleoid-associated protein YgaU
MKTRKAFAVMVLAAFSLSLAAASFGQSATSGAVKPAPKPATAAAKPAAPATATAKAAPAAKAAKAATEAEPAKVTSRSIVGEVVDPACWIVNGSKGAQHKECAIACAKAGQVLAIVETKSQKLFLVATDKPGEDPNKGLIDYVGQLVVVKGRVYTRGGATGIKVTSVEPYSATASMPQ